MKKTLAILLSLALLITAIPFATAMANTYDTAAAFYETETWATSQKKPTVTATQVQIAAPQYQNMVATLTLKPNTTYNFSVDFACNPLVIPNILLEFIAVKLCCTTINFSSLNLKCERRILASD